MFYFFSLSGTLLSVWRILYLSPCCNCQNDTALFSIYRTYTCADPEREIPPEKITKLSGFLAILVRIPRTITKLPSQHSMLGHYRPASETPLKWRFAGGPMMASFWYYLDPLSPHQLKTKRKKTLSKLDPL